MLNSAGSLHMKLNKLCVCVYVCMYVSVCVSRGKNIPTRVFKGKTGSRVYKNTSNRQLRISSPWKQRITLVSRVKLNFFSLPSCGIVKWPSWGNRRWFITTDSVFITNIYLRCNQLYARCNPLMYLCMYYVYTTVSQQLVADSWVHNISRV